MNTLALIEAVHALLPYGSPERAAFERKLGADVMDRAKQAGLDTADVMDKADALCEYGGPVLYHP